MTFVDGLKKSNVRFEFPIISFEAATDLEAGKLVELNSDGKVFAASADTTTFLGMVYKGGKAGEDVPIVVKGIVKCVAGAAVAPGAKVKVGTDGKVIAWDGSTDRADMIIGRALNKADADGDTVYVLF